MSFPPGELPPLRCTTTTSGDATTIACPSSVAGRRVVNSVDVLDHGPTMTLAVGGRTVCVRWIGPQATVSNGPC